MPGGAVPGPYGDVFFAADDRLLVTSTATGEADVWSRATGRPLVHVEGAGDGGLSVDVTQDGTRLLTLAGDGTLGRLGPDGRADVRRV